jgi:hypothetical protein
MGVSDGDFDRDGDADLFVTHMANEGHILFVQDRTGLFRDGTLAAGLYTPSLPYTGFGTEWLDFDNDGILDLFVVNGEVKVIEALERAGDPFPLHQRNQLFQGRGDGTLADVTDTAGSALEASRVGRGAAFGDLDNDGDTDVVVFNNNGPVQLLVNLLGQQRHWLGVEPIDARGRAALGARVELIGADPPLVAWAGSDGSYASANDPRVLFGLGDQAKLEAVRVAWPGGASETFAVTGVDRYVRLVEGDGDAVPR